MEKLNYCLKPHWENDTVTSMRIEASVDGAVIPSLEPALNYCADGFGGIVPFPEYDQLMIEDDEGEIPYELKEAPTNYGGIVYQGFYFKRPIKGRLRWSYRIYPRVLPEGYSSSPYYDFRSEPFGVNGTGCFAFILPDHDVEFLFSLHWDMAEMPQEAKGIWSFGAGDVEKEMNSWNVRFTYFAAGIMNSVEEGDFGIYWFGQTPFDIHSVTKRLCQLFAYQAKFFQDENPVYRIFLRRDPFEKSGGGSGALRSFMSGYSAMGGVDIEQWYNILAHEMVHNWPYMDDHIPGMGTWYTEGTAEYYSTMLPYRAGLADVEYTVRQINIKGKERYLDNIYRETPNMELPKIQWQDRRAQTVAYGRGFVYLSNVEAQLARANKGSIDDIVVKYGWDNPLTPEIWEAFLRERLGEAAIREFEDMKSGKLQIPDPDGFGEAFTVVEEEIELDGKKVKSYKWVLR